MVGEDGDVCSGINIGVEVINEVADDGLLGLDIRISDVATIGGNGEERCKLEGWLQGQWR